MNAIETLVNLVRGVGRGAQFDGLKGRFCADDGAPYERYVVVGTSGSGKSTLAAALADELGIEYVELDALHWLSGWEMRPIEEFRQIVAESVGQERWVMDGNYGKVRDIVWRRAQAVIWLDLPFSVVMRRIIWRSIDRAATRRELWNGCRETFRQSFLSRESVILWAARTWLRRRRRTPEILARPEYSHLDVFRVTDPGFGVDEPEI